MGKTKIKWLSHAGFQITSSGGKVIYIDPWFDNPVSTSKLDDERSIWSGDPRSF
jgi:L-ascorbate metabolism protein UlaG (beta-lactamase superfamily)